jgi:hypothetical protein
MKDQLPLFGGFCEIVYLTRWEELISGKNVGYGAAVGPRAICKKASSSGIGFPLVEAVAVMVVKNRNDIDLAFLPLRCCWRVFSTVAVCDG